MTDQNPEAAVITIREVYDKLGEVAETLRTHISRQDTEHAVLQQRVTVVERDLDRHIADSQRAHTDLKDESQREFAELRADLEGDRGRRWLIYAALIGAVAAVLVALLPLLIHK